MKQVVLFEDSILHLDLPWPPSVNHYWGQRVFKKRAIKFVGAEGLKFRKEVEELVKPHLEHCNKYYKKPNRLSITVEIYPPNQRRRDIDNLNKALLDALQHAGAYDDDEQIDIIFMLRDKSSTVKDGKVHIILSAVKFE